MPRFAYALPLQAPLRAEWQQVAGRLLGVDATAHRMFLLDRGIYRERVWLQDGEGTPPLTLVLWDCDDVDVATRLLDGPASDHERWLVHEVIGRFHGQDPATFAFPEPEVLSGTTARATAAAGTQTMFALPIPRGGVHAVRRLMERIESGDLATAHKSFLDETSIREEWIWLQPGDGDLPALLLIHWIGDDLAVAWRRLTQVGQDPYARVLRDALFTMIVGLQPTAVAEWEIEQLLAMHVRRSDSEEPPAGRLASRIVAAVSRRRWDSLERFCAAEVTVHDPAPTTVPAQRAMTIVGDLVAGVSGRLVDTLVGERQILCVIAPSGNGSRSGLLFGIRDGLITSVHRLPGWPVA